MLTPKDIQNKEFGVSMRGYSRKDVDEFLDQITIDYQNLFEENRKLNAQVEEMNHRMEEQKNSENSVMNTLEQAKRLMSDISESAEKRAEVIIRNARLDAQQITRNARESVANYTDESQQLKRHVNAFRDRYKRFLSDELSRLDSSVDELFEELRNDFYPGLSEGTGLSAKDEEDFFRAMERSEPVMGDASVEATKAESGKAPEQEQKAAADPMKTPTIVMDRSEVEGLAEKSQRPVDGFKTAEQASEDILRQIDEELARHRAEHPDAGEGAGADDQSAASGDFDERAKTIVISRGDASGR